MPLDIENILTLTAGQLIEVQANAFTGSAQFSNTQELRLIQFEDPPAPTGGGESVVLGESPPLGGRPIILKDIPGLTTNAPATGGYHLSASPKIQTTTTATP